MFSVFFVASSFFFICFVFGSGQQQNAFEIATVKQKTEFGNMPSWYFGFPYLLPFYYHRAIPDLTVTEVRSIFQDIHAHGPASLKKHQVRYGKVIIFMELQCRILCKNGVKSPHPLFEVDQSFCEALRPKMLRWFQYLSVVLPDVTVFRVGLDDTKDIRMFERNLGRMALDIISSLEDTIEAQPQGKVESVNATLGVLADISSTFELKLFSKNIASAFRVRVQCLLSLYTQKAFWPPNKDVTRPEESLQSTIPLDVLKDFFDCRYRQRRSFTQCAPCVLSLRSQTSMSLIELVHQIHREQRQFPESDRYTQMFSTFLLEGLINDVDFSTPAVINTKLREHLFQKVPVLPLWTCKEEYLKRRLVTSDNILPQLFSDFLEAKYVHAHESFSLHYTLFDVNRLLTDNNSSDISTELLTFDKGDRLFSFSGIYTKFIKIIQKQGYFFKALCNDYEDVPLAICIFLRELAEYEDYHEMLKCTLDLIGYYERQTFLGEFDVSLIREVIDILFDPDYLKEYWSGERLNIYRG